jgi:hypothetical protein
VKPQGDSVVIEPALKIDHPQPALDASFFYFDKDANPVKEDPQQPKLPLQAASTARTAHQPPAPREVRVAGRTSTE